MKKLAIVGAGNAGCISALHFKQHEPDLEIDLYHDSDHHPIERVGQGTTIPVAKLLSQSLDCTWYDNPIEATLKAGILYRNWGKIHDCPTERRHDAFFHDFYTMDQVSMHYTPKKLSDAVLSSKKFNVIEKEINDPEAEIDSDFIIDCRGKKSRDKENQTYLYNPIDSVLLGSVTDDCNVNILNYTDKIQMQFTEACATPNGWTFIVPTQNKISLGYLYNSTITTKEEATRDFKDRFGVEEVEHAMKFDNYCSLKPFVGERTLLNGNQCAFIEPLEATATGLYLWIARVGYDRFINKRPTDECIELIHREVDSIANFVLWHYKTGSPFDSRFWDYCTTIPFTPIQEPIGDERYGQWGRKSFDNWRYNTGGEIIENAS
tara:strand:+ start:1009 stop:2139 length:1131 start_codon:yes stop_codon:yes gene_type:complete